MRAKIFGVRARGGLVFREGFLVLVFAEVVGALGDEGVGSGGWGGGVSPWLMYFLIS